MIRTYLSKTPLAGSCERAISDDLHDPNDLRELLLLQSKENYSSSLHVGEYHSAALLIESAFEYQEAYAL